MKIELIKSYILAILVLISLLLTFILWNYKPNYERPYDGDYVDEINLGGTVETKADVIQPESIIFKRRDDYFGFSTPSDARDFYSEMKSWVLYDFSIDESTGIPNDTYQVELIFPTAISLDVLPSIFDMEEDLGKLPEWSFERMYLTLDEEKSTVNVFFLSVDERYQAQAVVKNAAKQDFVKGYMDTLEGMIEYEPLIDEEMPIYIPKGKESLPRHSATIDSINQISLVNALFSDPSAVRRNVVDDQTIYTDGQRQMSILYNRRLMKFVNPYQSFERMSSNDLLDISIKNINEYNGWTDTFHLQDIDTIKNLIRYQMYYKGYPVYNNSGLTVIEQEWHDQDDLVQYKRPLFNINDSLGGEKIELPSGKAIKKYLQDSATYDLEKIQNIQIGYRLSFQDSTFYTLNLEPTWYMKYNDKWQGINIEEDDMLKKEVR